MAKKNTSLAISVVGVALGMFALAYAAVPLYTLFCRVTGFGGTTQTAEAAPPVILDRTITVRFNADTSPALPWDFKPEQKEVTLRVGESGLAFYSAVNEAGMPVTGTSVYNVTPAKAGAYFNKVECFCFEEQTIAPEERVEFPVSFFVDPEIVNDKNLDDVKTITLSYTFFKVKES